jgi:mannobiose 2-epimerase
MQVKLESTNKPCCLTSAFKGKIASVKEENFVISTEVGQIEMTINSSTRFFQIDSNLSDHSGVFREKKIPDVGKTVGESVLGRMVIYPAFANQPQQQILCTELYLLGNEKKGLIFKRPEFWLKMASSLADWWLKNAMDATCGGYYTHINSYGGVDIAQNSGEKWTYIISRTLYGFCTSFALTGNKNHLAAAKHGFDFLYKHAFFRQNGYTLFHTRLDRYGNCHPHEPELLNIFTQIYGLTGLAAYYDISRYSHISGVINEILHSLDSLYHDTEMGGFYDAISVKNLKPEKGITDSKSFNSIVDPLSAVLFFLYTSTFPSKYVDIQQWLIDLCELISRHFICKDSVFIHEVFNRNWEFSKPNWHNQYNAPFESGNVGGCLKVIWVLLRAINVLPEEKQEMVLSKIAFLQHNMLSSGAWDALRGGWFKYMKQKTAIGSLAQHMYHTHKVWWQQEEGIVSSLLAYLFLKDRQQLQLAVDGMAFWLAYFVDRNYGGIFHTVSIDGEPVKTQKGGELKGGYHEIELARFAYIYLSILENKPVDLFYTSNPCKDDSSVPGMPACVPGLSWQVTQKERVSETVFRIRYQPI